MPTEPEDDVVNEEVQGAGEPEVDSAPLPPGWVEPRHPGRRAEDRHTGTKPHQVVNVTPLPLGGAVESLWERRAKSVVAVVMVFAGFTVLFNDQRARDREQAATQRERDNARDLQIQSLITARDAAYVAAIKKSDDAAEAAWRRRSEERLEGLKHATEFIGLQQKMNDKLDTLIELMKASGKTSSKPKTVPMPSSTPFPDEEETGRVVAPLPRRAG